jgi:hypothetical protein
LIDRIGAATYLPRVVVIDVALLDDEWVVLDANAAWGAGLNGLRSDRCCSLYSRGQRS